MTRQARLVRLPDGTRVWAGIDTGETARAPSAQGGADAPDLPWEDGGEAGDGYGDYEDVGALGDAAARVLRLRELITGVAASVRDAAARAGPDEVGVEFGVDFALRGGALVSVLADAQTSGSLKVTLTWRNRSGGAAPAHQRQPESPAVPPPVQPAVPPPAVPREPAAGGTDA